MIKIFDFYHFYYFYSFMIGQSSGIKVLFACFFPKKSYSKEKLFQRKAIPKESYYENKLHDLLIHKYFVLSKSIVNFVNPIGRLSNDMIALFLTFNV